MSRIFVSYRRGDSAAEASSIAAALTRIAGPSAVFFDTSTIRYGDPWKAKIDAALQDCETVVVVIGPRWLDAEPGRDVPRLLEPDDVVAYEVVSSLQRGLRVVPVLVDGLTWKNRATVWAGKPALPKDFDGLWSVRGPELRNDMFDDDVRAFAEKLLGPQPQRWPLIAGGVAALALVVAAVVALRPGPDGPPKNVDPPVSRSVDLEVALQARGEVDAAGMAKSPIEMEQGEPVPRGAVVLGLQQEAEPVRVFRYTGLELPPPGQYFFGSIARRDAAQAVKVTPALAGQLTTRICFKVGDGPPAAVRLDCAEGSDCKPAAVSPGPIAACNFGGTAWWQRLPWPPSAHAQPASAPAVDAPRAGEWLLPRLESLQARVGTPDAIGFSTVRVASGPLPERAGADAVAFELRINGTRLWTSPLPARAHAVPFDAGKGLDLAFALENLDASGADLGHEQLDVRLLFLKEGRLVGEDTVRLPFSALRTQPESEARGRETVVRWKAGYCPGASDRYQVLMLADRDGRKLQDLKGRIDKAGLLLGSEKLVVVMRPPNEKGFYALVAGTAQPNGQVRFSFDDARSKDVCRAMLRTPANARSLAAAGLEPASFYRREIAERCDEPFTNKPSDPCRGY